MTDEFSVDTQSADATDVPENPSASADEQIPTEDRLDAALSARYQEMLGPEGSALGTGEAKEFETSPDGDATIDTAPGGSEHSGQAAPATAIPAAWSKEMHQHWDTLPPQIQEYVSQRELDSSRKISEQGKELNRARPLVELFERYQQSFDRHGVTLEQGMESLMNAQAMLDQDPLRGIATIAQTYGIDLPKLFGPAYQEMDPALKQLVEHNRALQAQILNSQRDQRARQTADQRAAMERGFQQIDDWLTVEDRPYFDTVQDTMAVLLDQGMASNLDEAYDMACHANPATRQELAGLRAQQENASRVRAARNAKRKAATNNGSRRAVVSATNSDVLDDDAMAQRLEAILANA